VDSMLCSMQRVLRKARLFEHILGECGWKW
jgi:hypothetical protein